MPNSRPKNGKFFFAVRACLVVELGSRFNGRRRWPLHVRCCRKKFTFAISSPDKFLYFVPVHVIVTAQLSRHATVLFLRCDITMSWHLPGCHGKGKGEYLYSAILVRTHTLKALRHGSHSFTCKQHHACLSFVSVHQMAPPQLRQQTAKGYF